MQKTEILLKRRQGKLVLHIFAALFCMPMAIFCIINLITKFDWSIAFVAALVLTMAGIVGYRLMAYFTSGDVWLVVESDGKIIRFFNKNLSGKIFNKSEDIPLSNIKKFYVVRKRRRYGLNNYAFGYDKGKAFSSEEIDAFPSLFEATDQERQSVLGFVKSVAPEIELGYESIFQKLSKRK